MEALENTVECFINSNILDIVTQFCYTADTVINEQNLTDIQHVYVSFMRSSILNRLPLFRMDFYDSDILSSNEAYSLDFDVQSLWEFLDKEIQRPLESVSQSENRKNRLDYETEIYNLAINLHECVAETINATGFKDITEKHNFKLYYGDYLHNYTEIGKR